MVITSRSHNSSSVSYSVLSKATSDKGPTGNSCATLPNRRSRLSTQSPRTGRSEQVSTLTRIRPNPTEQYLVEDTTVNKEQTEPTLYYLHYTPTPSPYETVPAMCTYEKTSLPTVCLEHSAHCTPLKSILKNTTQGPLFVTPGDSLTAEQQAAFVSTPSSGVILDGTVHYVSAPLQQAEYVDGGNFLTFFPPPPPPT